MGKVLHHSLPREKGEIHTFSWAPKFFKETYFYTMFTKKKFNIGENRSKTPIYFYSVKKSKTKGVCIWNVCIGFGQFLE